MPDVSKTDNVGDYWLLAKKLEELLAALIAAR